MRPRTPDLTRGGGGEAHGRVPAAGAARDGWRSGSVGALLRSFSPSLDWEHLARWPPDVFAVANLLLDNTGAYRFAVAPPAGRRWPPTPEWNRQVVEAARGWRASAGSASPPAGGLVGRQWEEVLRNRHLPTSFLASGEAWDVCSALLTLHAIADEVCSGLAAAEGTGPLEERAWRLLKATGSLSRLPPGRVRVLPKTHFTTRGMTIRSLSRYLALSYESVEVHWRRSSRRRRGLGGGTGDFSIVLVPWPLRVRARDFRAVDGPLDNMDPGAFGFFEFAPDEALPPDHLSSLLRDAERLTERVDLLLLPEGALDASEVEGIEEVLAEHQVLAFVAGIRRPAGDGALGGNEMHLALRAPDGWWRTNQSKHNRWCLDEPQIRQYHLTRVLDPRKRWWEAIDLPRRRLQVLDLGHGTTAVPLVCEDLARMDEVADVVRCIGPSLVMALLLDGPQLASRWPCRYASVLADEPGSAVLTLTSLGMVARSTPAGLPRSRVVALWNDTAGGLRPIALGPGASGILLSTSVGTRTVWTADGRRHDDGSPDIVLSSVHQLRGRRPPDGAHGDSQNTSTSVPSGSQQRNVT